MLEILNPVSGNKNTIKAYDMMFISYIYDPESGFWIRMMKNVFKIQFLGRDRDHEEE